MRVQIEFDANDRLSVWNAYEMIIGLVVSQNQDIPVKVLVRKNKELTAKDLGIKENV